MNSQTQPATRRDITALTRPHRPASDTSARIDHADTSTALACERAFLTVLDGTCKTPIAGHATITGDTVQFRGLIARPDGAAAHDVSGTGHRKDAVAIGTEAGRSLKHRAGPGFFD